MMITDLPAASIGAVEQPRLHPVQGTRYSMPNGPTQAPPGCRAPSARGADRPVRRHVAEAQVLYRKVNADVDPAFEDRPLRLHLRDPAVQEALSILKSGMP